MEEIVILGFARTPFGALQGSLSTVKAPTLGALAIKAALERAKVSPDQVSEVFMGNVLSTGVGQAPARQAALGAGIPNTTPCTTLNKVCGSGMKAIIAGVQALRLGDASVVVAGGMENMSLAPYFLPGARKGWGMGDQKAVDSMVHDGLWDPYNNQHMGNCGELCARERNITREDQDAYAIESYRRALAVAEEGKWDDEIVPVEVPGRKGPTLVKHDEGPSQVNFDKVPQLRPVFDKEGTITAANASTINDGAVALVLTTASKAESLGVKPVARIVSYAGHANDPVWFTTAPAPAMKKAMDKAGWSMNSVDLFEVNEAFAVVALAVQRELGIPHDQLNVWGGAISIGHPIGASGARIVCTLLSSLQDRQLFRGVAGICIGGGEATALCVERV